MIKQGGAIDDQAGDGGGGDFFTLDIPTISEFLPFYRFLKGANAIGELLKRNSTLRTLELNNNLIDCSGFSGLAKALLENKLLQSLYLKGATCWFFFLPNLCIPGTAGFENCMRFFPPEMFSGRSGSWTGGDGSWVELSGKMQVLACLLAHLRKRTDDRIVLVSNYTQL
ncbi:hypothetical protein L2E82_22889 [Cichorium intybus]|uniref:Uncharacterized protein n=1 Tax=Cichorium intybus TaxID=13427 RepID=A0ACB9DZE1_CICIN|nr:hypothetical protein L2E82_22889 [Cichorium intybus]